MKKILILGGTGFLGKNVNKIFEEDDRYNIKNYSKSTGLDLLDFNLTKNKILEFYPDIIINCAAKVGSMKYVNDNQATVIFENIQMSLNIYQSLINYNKEILIINPLSNCSYPWKANVQNEENYWDGEIHSTVLPYGMSKKVLQVLGDNYNNQYKHIKTITLIIANAFGVYDNLSSERTHAISGLIIRFLDAIKNGENTLKIWGSGNPIREWVFMEDVAKIIKIIIDENKIIPNIINIGQEKGNTIKESAELIKELINFEGDLIFDTSYPDGSPIKILGKTKFNKIFPHYVFTEHKEGLKKTINYYKNEKNKL